MVRRAARSRARRDGESRVDRQTGGSPRAAGRREPEHRAAHAWIDMVVTGCTRCCDRQHIAECAVSAEPTTRAAEPAAPDPSDEVGSSRTRPRAPEPSLAATSGDGAGAGPAGRCPRRGDGSERRGSVGRRGERWRWTGGGSGSAVVSRGSAMKGRYGTRGPSVRLAGRRGWAWGRGERDQG